MPLSKVFVFVFDQPWQMLHELFEPVAALLGKRPDEMHMSLSVTWLTNAHNIS